MTRCQGMIAWLETQVGYPYVWGCKTGDPGWDCSGLTYGAYKEVGIILPHGSANQARFARNITVAKAHEGCLLFKKRTNGAVHHVAVVVTGGNLIEAKGKAWGVVKGVFVRKEWASAGKVDALYV